MFPASTPAWGAHRGLSLHGPSRDNLVREHEGFVKAAIFTPVPYMGPAPRGSWPVPTSEFSVEVAERSVETSLEQFELADQLGFDWVTVAEHHFAPMSLTPNPMIMAGALTQRVKHAKIALLGATIPILNPVRVAEEFAMLDTLTSGRVIAGMLRGTSNEYVTYATNPSESRERFEEALELIVKAWTEPQPFGWQGRYYEYRAISIWPRPVQQPHPPIYMSGSSPESGDFAARNHLKLGFAVTTVPLASEAAKHYRKQAHAYGWTPVPEDVLYRLTVHVADTDEQAMDDLNASGAGAVRAGFALSNRVLDDTVANLGYYGRDVINQRGRLQPHTLEDRIALGQLLAGGPETVVRQIREVRDALGCGILDLIFQPVGRDKTLKAIELFGTKVLPAIRDL
jgi:alkanesulfonate monooxygenase SsuD/methylene tetrahydromethanopterin reductase-like flavin-dependent oxidoreductase (luciferase family)